MAEAAREGLSRAAAGRAAVRDLARRLRRPAAARAAVDGRQLVLVGAPVDEHAAAAEPRAVGDRVGAASTSAGSSTTATASCSRAGPSSARSSRSAATTRAMGTARAGAVGVRRAVGERLPGDAASCGCSCCRTCTRLFEECHRTGAPILRPLLFEYPGRPGRPTRPTTSSCSVREPARWRRSRRPGIEHRHVYLPAGSWAHWWTNDPHRRTGTCAGARAAWASRPCMRAATRRFLCGPCLQHTDEVPDFLTWRVFAGGPAQASGALYEDAGDGYGPWCRRTAHVEEGGRFVLSAREGSFVPSRGCFVEVVGGRRVEVEETGEALVIERLVTTDD